MIEKYELHLLATDPIARYADNEAERRFARSISNTRKPPTKKRSLASLRRSSRKKKSAEKE